jgi:hypothetical protein
MSWSFSRWSDWDECAQRAAWSHLLKKARHLPSAPALERGSVLDKAGENFLLGNTRTLHKELQPAAKELRAMRAEKHKVIQEAWGFNAKWEPVSNTDWNNCKLRIKLDFGAVRGTHFSITDNKTGKFREDNVNKYEMQLDLYVAGAFKQLPGIKTADARLLYTDFGIVYPDAEDMKRYTRTDAEKLRKDWDRRVKPMLNATQFQPRPGYYCDWCPYRKGGKRYTRDGKLKSGGEVGGCRY